MRRKAFGTASRNLNAARGHHKYIVRLIICGLDGRLPRNGSMRNILNTALPAPRKTCVCERGGLVRSETVNFDDDEDIEDPRPCLAQNPARNLCRCRRRGSGCRISLFSATVSRHSMWRTTLF